MNYSIWYSDDSTWDMNHINTQWNMKLSVFGNEERRVFEWLSYKVKKFDIMYRQERIYFLITTKHGTYIYMYIVQGLHIQTTPF